MFRLPDADVRLVRFVRPLNPYKIGDEVTGDEYRTWPEQNRRAIVDQGFVQLIGEEEANPAAAALAKGDTVRVLVPRDDGQFDVLEGRKINAKPLGEAEAESLANGPGEPPGAFQDRVEPPPAIEQPEKEKRARGRPKGSKRASAKKGRETKRERAPKKPAPTPPAGSMVAAE
jgi:hypothetical protein